MDQLDAYQWELLKNLIAINTVNPPGNELKAAEYLAGTLSTLGFEVKLQPVGEGRANLVAELGDDSLGPTVALCGHLDVVAADAAQWNSDPFTLRERDGRLYGRGTVDMKGAISSMVMAAKDFVESGDQPRGRLILLFVADEEVLGAGSHCFVEAGIRPDAVLIGEPTDMDVCVAHRGVTRYHLDIHGKSGHASRPQSARNPIYAGARFALLAQEHNAVLQHKTHPILPPPTIAVTMASAGEQSNSIPGRCRVTVDRRTLPGEGEEAVRLEAETLFARIDGDGDYSHELDMFISVPGSEPLPDSTLAGDCQRLLEEMGINAAIRDFPACCDQHIYIKAGIDCLLVGPGSIDQAHTADEFVEARQLRLAREFYLRFMQSKLFNQ